MTRIHDTIIGADGRPVANVGVTVQLCAAPDLGVGEGFDLDALETIAAAGTTTTDATGKWSMTDVTPNTDVNPTGTVYRVTYTTPTRERQCFLINVPDTGMDVWVGSIVTVAEGELTTVVAGPPGPAGPAGPAGPPGTGGMTQAELDVRYINATGPDTLTGTLTVAGDTVITGTNNAAKMAAIGPTGSGWTDLNAGTTQRSGYIAWFLPGGQRICYVGFGMPGEPLTFTSDTGTGFDFANGPTTLKGPRIPIAKSTAPVAADYGGTIMPVGAIWIDTSGASSVTKSWTGTVWK